MVIKRTSAYLSRAAEYNSAGNKLMEHKDLQRSAQLGNEDARRILKKLGIGW